MRAIQSFLGSLDCYSRFIEDFTIYTSVMYELRDAEFFAISQMDAGDTAIRKKVKEDSDSTRDREI